MLPGKRCFAYAKMGCRWKKSPSREDTLIGVSILFLKILAPTRSSDFSAFHRVTSWNQQHGATDSNCVVKSRKSSRKQTIQTLNRESINEYSTGISPSLPADTRTGGSAAFHLPQNESTRRRNSATLIGVPLCFR